MPLLKCTIAILAAAILTGCIPGCPMNSGKRHRVTEADRRHPQNAAFIERFEREGYNILGGAILNVTESGGPSEFTDAWPCFIAAQEIVHRDEFVLDICYYDPPDPYQPLMQLQLLANASEGGFVVGDPGNPVIIVNLDQAQADHVMNQGVPQELIDAMIAAADAAGWTAELPHPNQYGDFVVVDPDPFFKIEDD